jgi:uncharacterized membrane protein
MKNFFLNPKFKLFLAALGTLDASYLTWEHFAKQSVFCLSANSCDRVLASAYATIGALPVSAVGVLYYGLLLALAIYLLVSKDNRVATLLFYITAAGLAMSVLFVGLQIFVIHAICYYCMFSALTTLLLFTASFMSVRELEVARQEA